ALPWVADLSDMQSSAAGVCARPDVAVLPRQNDVAITFSGYIQVPEDGAYTFYLTTDSGALLRLHEATVIDADRGYQSGSEVLGTMRLQAGQHPFRLSYARRQAGTPPLNLQWSSATLLKQEIAATAFSHDGAATTTAHASAGLN
ncbi:MAG: PA14 domain-containing protein, partial [Armatimonadota bacterium]|nr:PA14 domain-containing protein [Armatimonadota bacterium]